MKGIAIISTTLLAMVAPAGRAVALAPQAPVAAGPFSSLPQVLNAAHRCGISDLGIRTYGAPRLRGFELRLLDDATGVDCLVKWQTRNGKRLKLQPRWWKDDFTRDAPAPPRVR